MFTFGYITPQLRTNFPQPVYSDAVASTFKVASLTFGDILKPANSPFNETLQSASDNREALKWLYSFVRPKARAMSGLLLLSLFASALVLLQPYLTKLLIDDGLIAKDYQMLLMVSGGMIGVGLLSTVLSGINRYFHTQVSGQILFALREDVYGHLQTLSPRYFTKHRQGDLMARLDGDVAQIQRFAVDSLFSAFSSILGLVGATFMLLFLSWKLALLVFILIPVQVLYLRYMRKKVEVKTRAVRERASDMSSFLVETLPSMKFIQSVSAEQREAKRLNKLGDHYLQDLLKLQVVEFFTSAVPGTLTSWSRAAAFLIGGLWVIEGTWELGALIAFSTYLGMATGPVQSLLGLYVAVQRMLVSLDRVMMLRDAKPDIRNQGSEQLPESAVGELVIDDLSFAYNPDDQPVIHDASVLFPAGYSISIEGASGSGKSTLMDLIHRHFDPDKGRILLDGIDIRDLSLVDLRRHITTVSQDVTLFRGSVFENIRYAKPDATRDEVEAALNDVQLGDWIASLPEGMDTPIGERGGRLSGGQKQRIALARALLLKPKVLILDEATSAIDVDTEKDILQAVNRIFDDCTRLIISHRDSTRESCDYRLILENGRTLMSMGEACA